jgi:hypothetical protein
MGLEKVTTQSGGNATLPSGVNIAGDNVLVGPDTLFFQMLKLDKGTDGASSPINDANPLPVNVMNKGSSLITPIANSAVQVPLVLNTPVPLPAIPATANGARIMLQEGDANEIVYREDSADPTATIYNLFRSSGGETYFVIDSRARLLGLRLMLKADPFANGAALTVTYYSA